MSLDAAIILAAGKGTRMKSGLVKVMHETAGIPMLAWPVAAARQAGAREIIVVAGHQSEKVAAYCAADPSVKIALQEEQLGTGHAVMAAVQKLENICGSLFILCGDTPLLTAATLEKLAAVHEKSAAAITVLTARLENPSGYGRIVRDSRGMVSRITEQKDATAEELAISEVNSGIYCVDTDFLRNNISRLGSENAQKEYYLTDLAGIAVSCGLVCTAVIAEDASEISGVNDRLQLADATRILRQRINRNLMLSGVTLVDPDNTYIDSGVTVGADTVIWPGCVLRGKTSIGSGCQIESNVMVTDSLVSDNVHIKSGSVLSEATVAEDVSIGPMAHLRPGSVLQAHVKIGNFVETKKVVMGEGSKASHLTYLGDAEIGSEVNIGCGTITCNYDGKNKHRTVIGNGVFVGSDVQFVAPVTVGANSLIAAGTTVTGDVPPDSLALARTPQINKVGWCLKKRDNG